MENENKYSHIKGWGVDADPKNEPTYPMKKYTGDDHQRLKWERPPQQPVNMEVLHSIERPNLTAVYGTSVPPSGLSGVFRRFAFKYSESLYRHWLPLILADRINVVEGIVDDLKRGYIPNIWAEKGLTSAWQHNRKGLITKVATGAVLTTVLIALMARKK
jgi:hypothetical protein